MAAPDNTPSAPLEPSRLLSSGGSGVLPQSTQAAAPPPSLPPTSPAMSEHREHGQAAAAQQQEKLSWWARFKRSVKRLKKQVLALHYAMQDPRVGFLPRLLAFLVIAYALSPFDLIPDFIPVLGLIDDLLLLPGMLVLAIWLIPDEVMKAARQRAENEPLRLSKNWGMALVFFAMWDALLLFLVWWGCAHFGSEAVHQYKVWIVAGCGMVVAAAELGWAVVQCRKERRQYQAVLAAAGACEDMQEALLNNGNEAVNAYLEP